MLGTENRQLRLWFMLAAWNAIPYNHIQFEYKPSSDKENRPSIPKPAKSLLRNKEKANHKPELSL